MGILQILTKNALTINGGTAAIIELLFCFTCSSQLQQPRFHFHRLKLLIVLFLLEKTPVKSNGLKRAKR